ncbi:MAG: hypothetical protein R3F20_11390 [Planctomycetota bacterium]
MRAELDAALDRVLTQVAEDPALGRAMEGAAEVNHLTDEVIAAFLELRLDDEQRRNVRRHVLLCDECSGRTLEVAKDRQDFGLPVVDAATASVARQRRQQEVEAETRRLRRAVAACAAMAVIAAVVWMSFPRVDLRAVDAARAEEPRWSDVYVLRDGRGIPAEGRVASGEELFLHVEQLGRSASHCYVVALDERGVLHALHPEGREDSRLAPGNDGLLVVPAAAREGQRTRGWRLDHLTGARFAIFALFSRERRLAFEGELRDLVVLPKLAEEAGLAGVTLDEDVVAAFADFVQSSGLADEARGFLIERRVETLDQP